jgi:hypothetical protein
MVVTVAYNALQLERCHRLARQLGVAVKPLPAENPVPNANFAPLDRSPPSA